LQSEINAAASASNAATSATEAAASAAAVNLPSALGQGLNLLRQKSTEDGFEYRTPEQTRQDLGAFPAAAIPTGTKMLFQQTAAPTGWTKDTTHDNKALRVVSGTAGSGGSVAFSTAFASQEVSGSVGNTTLTTAQMPSHTHQKASKYTFGAQNFRDAEAWSRVDTTDLAGQDLRTGSAGSSNAHNHSFTGTAINLAVSYVDLIIATKD
jgi:hypothetical protein